MGELGSKPEHRVTRRPIAMVRARLMVKARITASARDGECEGKDRGKGLE